MLDRLRTWLNQRGTGRFLPCRACVHQLREIRYSVLAVKEAKERLQGGASPAWAATLEMRKARVVERMVSLFDHLEGGHGVA